MILAAMVMTAIMLMTDVAFFSVGGCTLLLALRCANLDFNHCYCCHHHCHHRDREHEGVGGQKLRRVNVQHIHKILGQKNGPKQGTFGPKKDRFGHAEPSNGRQPFKIVTQSVDNWT